MGKTRKKITIERNRDRITIAFLSDEPFRHVVVLVLREELRKSQETEYLVDWVEDMWAAIDTLVDRFGKENAKKIILARSALPRMLDGCLK